MGTAVLYAALSLGLGLAALFGAMALVRSM